MSLQHEVRETMECEDRVRSLLNNIDRAIDYERINLNDTILEFAERWLEFNKQVERMIDTYLEESKV